METRKIMAILVLALGLVLGWGKVSEAAPMGTAFTYQGLLYDANHVANGQYDFQFKLFDSLAGSQVDGDVNIPDVNVSDGYFTVELDFNDVYDGNERWLEIGVRPGDLNDPNIYTLLSPRQEVTATPYAFYAKSSGGDDDWMVSDGNMYSIPSGNVGIGTTEPTELLDVRASGTTMANINLQNSQDNADGQIGAVRFKALNSGHQVTDHAQIVGKIDCSLEEAELGQIDFETVLVESCAPRMTIKGTKVGVGTTQPDDFLEIEGDLAGNGIHIDSSSGAGIHIDRQANNNYYQLVFKSAGNKEWCIGNKGKGDEDLEFYSGGSGTPSVVFEAGGNVGIGTPSPSAKLDIDAGADVAVRIGSVGYGSLIRYQRDGGAYSFYAGIPDSGQSKWQVQDSAHTALLTVKHDGYVGIGMTNPEYKLEVGNAASSLNYIRIHSSGWGGLMFYDGEGVASGALRYHHTDDSLELVTKPAGGQPETRMVITSDGKVGIGRWPTTRKLEVEGNASKTTAGDWAANSDARIKTDVHSISDALETLRKVRLVSFKYTDDYRAQHPSIEDRCYVNVIAQEFREIFPDYVKTSGEKLSNGDQILQVDAYPLTVYSAAAVQELHAIAKTKDAEIAELKERVSKMEAVLAKLSHEREGGAK